MSEVPLHLFFPLTASILSVCGLLLIKRASEQGIRSWTVTFFANQWAALVFSCFWFLGGQQQPVTMLWQPAVIAGLYIVGQVFTFLAIERGDVSVATPVLGIKVIVVALMVARGVGQHVPTTVWLAAMMSTCGIALVQWTGAPVGQRKRVTMTVTLAVASACSFALFDVLVQTWSPAWGTGRILPYVFWFVAVFSLVFWPAVQIAPLADKRIRRPLMTGTLLIAMQAIFIVFALSRYGDAPRINVVYALRGLWGVLFAWAVALKWGGNEAHLPARVMVSRLLGAVLLTAAVMMVIFSKSPSGQEDTPEARSHAMRDRIKCLLSSAFAKDRRVCKGEGW